MSMLEASVRANFGDFTCGTHRALIYALGGQVVIGELTPLLAVQWNRIRDDISQASVFVASSKCCELLGNLRCISMELHILRDDAEVWCGPITRLEYDWDICRVYAEDMLWVAKRRVLEVGYNQSYPNIGNVIDRMDWLLRTQCYGAYGDNWRMTAATTNHLHPLHHSGKEPGTTRVVNPYQVTIWEDFDKYAEDMGADYTVLGRDIYYWDNQLAWATLPPLTEEFISQFPRIVEYGNQLYNRAFVTNGRGYAGRADNPDPAMITSFGGPVDDLITNAEEGDDAKDPPAPEELKSWSETAAHIIDGMAPAPVAVVIPANTTLMPGAPWNIDSMLPGAWFQAEITQNLCRVVTEWQRINEVVVTESAPQGEVVQFTAASAPVHRVEPG